MAMEDELPALHRQCDRCQGMRTVREQEEQPGIYYPPVECPDCQGTGRVATAAGEQILDLVRRWNRRGLLL